MKIYKITEASAYIGVSINSLKTLANNGKIKSFSTTGKHRRFRQEDLDAYMGVEKEKQETKGGIMQQPINIIFDGPPGHDSGFFVEVETDDGKSVNAGKWIERDDGLWALRITELPKGGIL